MNAVFTLLLGVLGFVLPGGSHAAAPGADLEASRALQIQERWAPSESLATAALTRLEAEVAPDSIAMAGALELIATARWKLLGYSEGAGMKAASRSLGIRLRRLGPEHLQTAAAHSLIGRFLSGTGRPDSARVHVQQALDIRTKQLAADDTLLAKTWDHLALVHRDRQDFQAALDSWNHAIDIRKRVHGPEHPEVALLLAQTGVPWMQLGDIDRAKQVLEESLAMFARTNNADDPRRATPLNILSDTETRLGNFSRAIDLSQEAIRVVGTSRGRARESMTLQGNLAGGLQRIGDYGGARAIYERLLPLLEAQYGRTHPRVLTVLIGLCRVNEALGDTAATMRYLLEVDAALSRPGATPHLEHSVVRGMIAIQLAKQGHDVEARRWAESAIQVETSRRQVDHVRLATVYDAYLDALRANRDTTAVDSIVHLMDQFVERYRLHATDVGAQVEEAIAIATRWRGHPDLAWSRALEAERLSRESLIENLRTAPDRRALQLSGRDDYYLDLVMSWSGDAGEDRWATAWDRLVRSRGLVRAEIARRRPLPGFESDSGVVQAHRRWMDAQRRLARRLVRSGGAPGDSAARASLDALRASADSAEGAYSGALAVRGAHATPSEGGLAEVRARLQVGDALVACFVVHEGRMPQRSDDEHLIAFVAHGGALGLERIDLGPTLELRTVIEPWQELLSRSPGPGARAGDQAERECRRLGREVRGRTWNRIAPHLAEARHVYLVADGPLLDLPWQALPDGTNRYLVETGPRLHVLNAEREIVETPLDARSGTLLALGAPAFDRHSSDDQVVASAFVRAAPDPCVRAGLPVFAPIPGSGVEADAVARTWKAAMGSEAVALKGSEATELAFKTRAPGCTILHLATHGMVAGDTCRADPSGTRGVGVVVSMNQSGKRRRPPAMDTGSTPAPNSPWMSRRVWLALAGSNQALEHEGDENEGFLTAEEVLTLDLQGTDWVVLSACHSGLAESWSRDGALGMRRAFDLAGARSVIASQWAVEDDDTLEWMQGLYTARSAGVTSASAAIESACRRILAARRRDGRSTHPFYWAAFSASGE